MSPPPPPPLAAGGAATSSPVSVAGRFSSHPFASAIRRLTPTSEGADRPTGPAFFSLCSLGEEERIKKLPFCIRVLLEAAVRSCDNFSVKRDDVEKLLDWPAQRGRAEVPFKPSRVLLQDFTGVPAVVDLAAMRDAMARLGGDPKRINPLVPVDLVIDHSVQVDFARTPDSRLKNEQLEFERNSERFSFLKWGASAFDNLCIVPPGMGIVHQVNLEYLARCVFEHEDLLYPDSLVGTDSHTTMIGGLGVVGWGVGGIEAEAVMLGQPISMLLPNVVGFKLTGRPGPGVTATDLVLTITQMLRKRGVVGQIVEFFGDGCAFLSVSDRATIANMSPEYGATLGFFAVDDETMKYLRLTGRSEERLQTIRSYLSEQKLFRTNSIDEEQPTYSGELMTLELASVVPSLSGPKRPHDRVAVTAMKSDFQGCLVAPVGFKGFGLSSKAVEATATFELDGKSWQIGHGSVVIAAITSCTNTSNPSVMLGAGLLARNATKRGLAVAPYIKTSLSPGSGVVLRYLKDSGLLPHLEQLGFYTAGLGCMTCIGNSGELRDELSGAITSSDLVVASVLSGNRNFEGRVHPLTRANYLASPALCIAYALAGTVAIDLTSEPLGRAADGTDVFLKDIWPDQEELAAIEAASVRPALFSECYGAIQRGNERWNSLEVKSGELFSWEVDSTYVHNPPFFKSTSLEPEEVVAVRKARCLLYLGDSITTDHISPAGKIARDSPAARFLIERGVATKDFNSYGSRRGNDQIMARGTFANIRLVNFLSTQPGPVTRHFPSMEESCVFDVAARYSKENTPLIILAGAEYGSGSSRDWAAKGPHLLGVRAVIAVSYERIHRSNLVGMGILPLEFLEGQTAQSLGLSGQEEFDIFIEGTFLGVRQTVDVTTSSGKNFKVLSRLDTEVELEYFRNGGILQYVLRRLVRFSLSR